MVNNNNIESTGSKLANNAYQVWTILPALELLPLDLPHCCSVNSQWEAIPSQAICIKHANSDRSIVSIRSALLRFLQARAMIGGLLHIYQYQRQPLWDDHGSKTLHPFLINIKMKLFDTYYYANTVFPVVSPQRYRIVNNDCFRL